MCWWAAHRHAANLPTVAPTSCLVRTCPAGELATLLGELHKMHTKPDVQMMIQDLTPNNLLVDDSAPDGGMRLLLADPAMARSVGLLQDINK